MSNFICPTCGFDARSFLGLRSHVAAHKDLKGGEMSEMGNGELRKVIREETQNLREIERKEERIKVLEKQILTMVDGVEVEKRESLIASLKKQIEETKDAALVKRNNILNTGHENIEDLLSCPECLLGHIRKIGFDKAAEEICKDDEACRANIAQLIKKGYKIEEPEKSESDSDRFVDALLPREKEPVSGFTLGRSEE